MKPGQESEISGRIYFDDLRIVTKAEGDPPMNSAPVITALPDTIIENGDNFIFTWNFLIIMKLIYTRSQLIRIHL